MKNEEIIIFLNQEDEKIYIKGPKIETYFQLQNLAGKVIHEGSHANGYHDFDVTGLPDGNYFVLVQVDGIIRSKKITLGYHP